MEHELHIIATLFCIWIVLWMVATMTQVFLKQDELKLRKETNRLMATADQALVDLTQVFADLVTSNKRIAADFDQLLTRIQQANGVDTVAVEKLTQTGRDLVNTMNDEAAKVEAVLNPPAPEQPAPPAETGGTGTPANEAPAQPGT